MTALDVASYVAVAVALMVSAYALATVHRFRVGMTGTGSCPHCGGRIGPSARKRHRRVSRIRDPFRARLRAGWCRFVWCRIVGHAATVKMDGTALCRRH